MRFRWICTMAVLASACSSQRPPPPPRDAEPVVVDNSVRAIATHEEGRVKSVFLVVTATGRELEITYDRAGNLRSISAKKDGRINGPAADWANGHLESSGGANEAGRSDGKFHGFYETGSVMLENAYVDGERDGEQRQWYRSGKLEVIERFERGWPATRTEFFEEGTIREEVAYMPRRDGEIGVAYRRMHVRRRCRPSDPLTDVVRAGAPVVGSGECPTAR